MSKRIQPTTVHTGCMEFPASTARNGRGYAIAMPNRRHEQPVMVGALRVATMVARKGGESDRSRVATDRDRHDCFFARARRIRPGAREGEAILEGRQHGRI